MPDKTNIHHEIFALCEVLKLVPMDVRRFEITPTKVVADVYLRNENGSKYVNDDGDAATEVHEFQVVT